MGSVSWQEQDWDLLASPRVHAFDPGASCPLPAPMKLCWANLLACKSCNISAPEQFLISQWWKPLKIEKFVIFKFLFLKSDPQIVKPHKTWIYPEFLDDAFWYQSPCPIECYFDFQIGEIYWIWYSSLATPPCCLPFIASTQPSSERQARPWNKTLVCCDQLSGTSQVICYW